jgi:hypothetical protein
VGPFIGRLGVVSIPAVEVGLDLDQRVVRRHVAKLEAAGWLAREPWIWGEGSVVWLTGTGIERVGLGGVRPIKTPPRAMTVAHGVLVGWSAARAEHRGRTWKSARELAVERETWAVTARCERGYTELLPDLAVWLERSAPPVALIAESGGRREDRQKMILDGWHNGILSGRYSAVHYHCASPSVAHWISRLAKKVGLTGRTFHAEVQMTAEEIAALLPAANDPDELSSHKQPRSRDTEPSGHEQVQIVTARAMLPPPAPEQLPEPPPEPQPETAEAAAERRRQYREIFGTEHPFGVDEPAPRRRWRR